MKLKDPKEPGEVWDLHLDPGDEVRVSEPETEAAESRTAWRLVKRVELELLREERGFGTFFSVSAAAPTSPRVLCPPHQSRRAHKPRLDVVRVCRRSRFSFLSHNLCAKRQGGESESEREGGREREK